jgi:hypothetical protein
MNHVYTGIGSRNTPEEVLLEMRTTAYSLCEMGFTLRSGKAQGADSAFQSGFNDYLLDSHVKGQEDLNCGADIYLPWKGFNCFSVNIDHFDIILDKPCMKAAQDLASRHHPNWGKCSDAARKLHGRNSCQVLGTFLDIESDFVLYYAPENEITGKIDGGTATAVNIARYYNIPTINMLFDGWEYKLASIVNP